MSTHISSWSNGNRSRSKYSLDFLPTLCPYSPRQPIHEEGTMSTASRYCGSVGGTCGGGITQDPAPGATGGTRGHYDPRATGNAEQPARAIRKRLPEARNAALPRKRAGASGLTGAATARRPAPAGGAHRAVFPIGLRGRPSRHSLPPPPKSARGPRHGRHPP